MLNFFKSSPKPYDFIITKKTTKKGKKIGGLVMRIEEQKEDFFLCSLGSFQLYKGEVIWKINRTVNLSSVNIEQVISKNKAKDILLRKIKEFKNEN